MNSKTTISLAILALACAALLAARAFTPVRPLSQLKEQDPVKVIAQAPESAQLTLPVRYYRGQAAEINNLASITNALTLGQLLLQQQLRETTALYVSATNDLASITVAMAELRSAYDREAARAARLDALREWLVTLRDAATLPTTKALYQAIIDRIDNNG